MIYSTVKQLSVISLLLLAIVPFLSLAGSGEQPDLKGKTTAQTILKGYPDFNQEYLRFEPSASDFQHMSTLTGKSMLVMFGSWCHDSAREVPRLIKLLEKSDVKLAAVNFLAVDDKKQEDSGLAKQYELKYIPKLPQDARFQREKKSV